MPLLHQGEVLLLPEARITSHEVYSFGIFFHICLLELKPYIAIPKYFTESADDDSVLRVLNRARCRRCSRCRCFLVSHWIISICRLIGGQIKLSTCTYYTSPLFKGTQV